MAELKYHFGMQARLYPSPQQKRIIRLNCYISRFVYNKMVEINTELYHLKQTKIYIAQVADRIAELETRLNNLAVMKTEYPILSNKDIDSLTISNSKRSYRNAWNNFKKVKRAKPPTFHKKGYLTKYQTSSIYSNKSAMTPYSGNARFTTDMNHVKLPKLGIIRISGSHKRILQNKNDIRIGTITIKEDSCGKFYISFSLASDTPFVTPKPKTGKQLGIDLNTDNFLTDSNGAMVENPRFYRKQLVKLAHAQRKLSRRQRRAKAEKRPFMNAKNLQKQRKIVSRLHNRIRNQRSNFINNITNELVTSQDLVVAERLLSSNMIKNHRLAMSISDVGWREFLTNMTYKANLYGKQFIMIDPRNTTQTCADCGHIMGHDGTDKLTLAVREWTCPECGAHHIRDWNAARNILAKGLYEIAN